MWPTPLERKVEKLEKHVEGLRRELNELRQGKSRPRFSLTAFIDALGVAGLLNGQLSWDFDVHASPPGRLRRFTVVVPITLYRENKEDTREALVAVAERHGLKPNCDRGDDFWLMSEPFEDLVAK